MLLPGAVFHADPSDGRIYLTYDDGPDPEVTPELLRILTDSGALATFFVLPSNEPWWPDLIGRIAAAGHSIGLHGREHRSGYWRTNASLFEGLAHCAERIGEAGAAPLKAYRPPFGHIRPDTVAYLKRRGFTTVLWSNIPGDFRLTDPEVILARSRHSLEPGSIVVLHDGTRLRPAPVLEVTRKLLAEIGRRGWQCTALSFSE